MNKKFNLFTLYKKEIQIMKARYDIFVLMEQQQIDSTTAYQVITTLMDKAVYLIEDKTLLDEI